MPRAENQIDNRSAVLPGSGAAFTAPIGLLPYVLWNTSLPCRQPTFASVGLTLTCTAVGVPRLDFRLINGEDNPFSIVRRGDQAHNTYLAANNDPNDPPNIMDGQVLDRRNGQDLAWNSSSDNNAVTLSAGSGNGTNPSTYRWEERPASWSR